MEISETLAHYLKSLDLADPLKSEKTFKLSESDFELFRSGQQFFPLLKQLPIPESLSSQDLLKNFKSSTAKLYNWKVIFKLLSSINIEVDPDWQQQILNGDSDLIISLLERIMKKHKKLVSPSRARGKRPRLAPEGALYIETIDPKRELMMSNSCLEFLILSLCQSFEIPPKQAAGLLTQNNKFLAHIIVKGLKGSHEKVQNWLVLITSKFTKVKLLIENEINKGSLQLVLNAVKPALLSKQMKTIEKCADFLKLVFLEIDANDVLWDWLCNDTLELCALALKRSDEYVGASIARVFLALTAEQLFDVVSEKIKKFLENSEYLKSLQNLYMGLVGDKEKMKESGIVDFYLHFALSNVEVGKKEDKSKNYFGLGKVNLVICLWRDFYLEVNENANEILVEVKRLMKDCSINTKILLLGQLFDLIYRFYQEKHESASIVLKTLIFSLVENYENENLREFLIYNFILLMENIESLPIAAILDPLLKQIQYFQSIRFTVVDHEFFLTVSRHPKTSVENLVILLDILSKAFLEDLLYSKACEFSILYIIGTFFDKNPIAEYTFKLCDLTFSLISSADLEKFSKPSQKSGFPSKTASTSEVEININIAHRKRIIFDLFSKLIKLRNLELNEHIKKAALINNWTYKKTTKINLKGFEVLLGFFGDPEELIRAFEINAVEPYQESPQSEQNIVAYKPPAITGRAAEDIEKIKNQRKAALEKKAKLEEEHRKKQQKLYESAKNDVNNMLSKQEKIGILDKNDSILITSTPVEYFDLSQEPKNELEIIEKISKRFALPLKLLFNKYCKPVIIKQKPDLGSFDENHLNEAQIMNLLKGEQIVPQKLRREDALWVLKETCRRETGLDVLKISRKNFAFTLFQVAGNVFRDDDFFEITPLAARFYQMIVFFRSIEKSFKVYDEPDPGTADREVINFLNEKLKNDPGFPLPHCVFKCVDYEFEVNYSVPKVVKIKKAQKVAVEIIDSILFDALQVHFLRPSLKSIPITIARGANISENPNIPVLPIYLSVSPNMKYNILRFSDKYSMDALVETGKVLEEVLGSVVSGKVLKFSLGNTSFKNSFLKQKELETLEIENRKAKAESLRKQRKAQLDDFLKQKRAEIDKQEENEVKEKELKTQQENKKQMEAEEKRQKANYEKKKMIEEWKFKKNEEEKEKTLKLEKEKKPVKSASQSLLPLLNKRLTEITKKSKKDDPVPTPNTKTSNLTLKKVLSESRRHAEFEQRRKDQFFEYFNQSQVRDQVSQYSSSLKVIFIQQLKLSMNTSDPESGLNFKGLNKFCLDYSIQPTLVATSFINSSFNRLTKDKNKFINFEDFLEFLAEVSFSAESLKEKDNDSVLFTSLMRHMKITLEKSLKKKS